jgi:hypothetical protein
MKTQFRKAKKQSKRSFLNALVVKDDAPVAKEAELWTAMSWREAGELFVMLALLGVLIFGLHYFVYRGSEGEPPRRSLITGYSTVITVMAIRIKGWNVRGRFLAAFASAMAVTGLLLRFVIGDSVAFSPIHIACNLAILLVMWLASDAYDARKAKTSARS